MSYNPGAFGAPYVNPQQFRQPGSNSFLPGAGTVLTTLGGALVDRYLAGGSSSTASAGTGSAIAPYESQGPPLPPHMVKKRRRRRRKLLTASDKADIAFLHGQLGGGALGRAAISTLLSRRCG